MKKTVSILMIIVCLLLSAYSLFAQTPNGNPDLELRNLWVKDWLKIGRAEAKYHMPISKGSNGLFLGFQGDTLNWGRDTGKVNTTIGDLMYGNYWLFGYFKAKGGIYATEAGSRIGFENDDGTWEFQLPVGYTGFQTITVPPDPPSAAGQAWCGNPDGSTFWQSLPQTSYSITYSDLLSKIAYSQLTAGTWYLIYDFATKHYILDGNSATGSTNTGSNEPILVLATSVNTIGKQAVSTVYPQDVIYYDYLSSNWVDDIAFGNGSTIISGWKGVIYYRHDTKQDISAWYDFRAVKFRRWRITPDAYIIGADYSKGDWVKSSYLYRAKKEVPALHSPSSSSDEYWLKTTVPDYYHLSPYSSDFLGIPVSTEYEDLLTFQTVYYSRYHGIHLGRKLSPVTGASNTILPNIVFTGYSPPGTGYLISNLEIKGGYNFGNSTILVSGMANNSFGYEFHDNLIANCNNTSAGDGFSGNVINGSGINSLGPDFHDNTIDIGFTNNSILQTFAGNYIGANFTANTVQKLFQDTVVGDEATNATVTTAIESADLQVLYNWNQSYAKEITTNESYEVKARYINAANTQVIDNP